MMVLSCTMLGYACGFEPSTVNNRNIRFAQSSKPTYFSFINPLQRYSLHLPASPALAKWNSQLAIHWTLNKHWTVDLASAGVSYKLDFSFPVALLCLWRWPQTSTTAFNSQSIFRIQRSRPGKGSQYVSCDDSQKLQLLWGIGVLGCMIGAHWQSPCNFTRGWEPWHGTQRSHPQKPPNWLNLDSVEKG